MSRNPFVYALCALSALLLGGGVWLYAWTVDLSFSGSLDYASNGIQFVIARQSQFIVPSVLLVGFATAVGLVYFFLRTRSAR